MSGLRKLGVFFTILGLFLLALFVFSDMAKQPEFGLLLAGMAITGFGIFLMVTNPGPPPEPNPRFRLVRGVKAEPQPKGPPGGGKAAPAGPPKGAGAGGPPKGGAPPKAGGPPPKGKPGKK